MIKQLLRILAIVFTGFSYGQSVSINTYTGSGPLTGCTTSSPFQFNVTNPSPFIPSDTVFFNFSFTQGIQLETFTITGIGPGVVGFTANTAYITGLSGNPTVTVQHQLKLNCNLTTSGSFSASHQMTYNLNHGTNTTINSNPYTATPSSLVFVGGTNLNYNLAQFNVPITRSYVFRNSSNNPFSGYFSFKDTTFYDQNTTAFRLDSVYISYGSATETAHLLNDSTALLNLQITNLAQSDSIVITETGYLIGCQTSALENSTTRFSATYGCTPTDVCKPTTYSIVNQALAHFDPNDKPIALLDADEHYETCLQQTTHLRHVIKNIGAGAANGARLEYNSPIAFPQTINATAYYLDSLVINSIQATVGGQLVPITYYQGNGNGYHYIHAIANIPAGDSIVFEYDVFFNCIDSSAYNLYFNHIANLHPFFHPTSGWLFHPCGTNSYNYNQGYTNHPQKLEQSFNSLVGQMNDGTTAWFQVENASPLILGNLLQYNDPILIPQGTTYLVPYDLDNAVIEVRLQLENGLLFPNLDSIFMSSENGATTTMLYPFNTFIIPGTGIGTGDEIVAQFHIPINWSIPYSLANHDYDLVTAEFLQFFNSFKVNFELQADCSVAPSNGVVHVVQQFFINPTPSCGDCKLPLSQVGSFTNINCPGCVLPGWNLTSFSLERQNIGSVDANNNHLPDGYPLVAANAATINLAAAMIGDTLRGSITGFVSDGQDFDTLGNPIGFTFASAGFAFDEGMIEFSQDVVADLAFIGGSGSITIGATTYPFIVPNSSFAQISTNGNIGIPMNIAALNAYGVPAFTGFNATVTDFEFYPEFRVIHNLNNASSGGNPYYAARNMNCFLHMGGTEFTIQGLSQGNYAEANTPSNTAFLVASSGAVRSGFYKYWCTAYEGRFLGVGIDLKTRSSVASENTYPTGSLCAKGISYQHMVSSGKAIYDPALGPNQTSANIYHNEIRSIGTMDSLTFNFPADYEPYLITFHNYDVAFDSINNVHNWSHIPRTYPLSDAFIANDYVTIFPAQFIDQLTYYPLSPYHYANEENQLYDIAFYLRPKECGNLPDLTPYTNPTIDVSFSNYPLALNSSDTTYSVTIATYPLRDNLNFRNPNAELILTEQGNGVSANNSNYWDVNLTTEAIIDPLNPLDQAIIHSAENVFVTFDSPSGNFSNIHLTTVTTYTGANQNSALAQQIPLPGSNPAYGLNFIGYNNSLNQLISKQFRINADFDCSNLPAGARDSIYVIKGWNCFNYPATLEDACFIDTAVLYFIVPETAIQVSVFHEDTISTCSVTDVSIEFDPTLGETDSISITLFDSPFQSYSYIAGSGYLTNTNGTTYYEPLDSGNALYWNLDGLSSIFSEPVVFNYQLQTACNFEIDSVFMNLKTYNYCGLMITDIDNYWSPTFISNLPEQDSISLQIETLTVNQCGELMTLTVQITNEGTTSTGGLNTIEWVLPSGFSYSGNNPLVSDNNDTLTFSIPANVNPSATFDFLVNLNTITDLSCDSLSATFTINYLNTYLCGLDTCSTSSGQSSVFTTPIIIDLPSIQISTIETADLCAGTNSITLTIQSSDTTTGILSVIDLYSNTVIGSSNITVSSTPQTTTIILTDFSDSLAFVYDGCSCDDTLYYSFICDTICVADASFTVDHLCIGDTIVAIPVELEGTHEWVYSYFNITSTADTALFPAAAVGSYTITHIYTNLCGDSDTAVQQIQVSYPIFTSIVLQGSSPFCLGDSVAITLLNAVNYDYFDWNTGDTTNMIWADSAGVYHVNVTDTNGCVSHCPSIAISTVEGPEPINDTLYLCSLIDTLMLDAGDADTYLWSNGSSSQTLTITASGIYTVEACNTTLTTCCVTDTFVVVLENFTFEIPDTMVCNNSVTVINSPLSSSEYLWSTGSTSASTIITQSGTHWLTLLSANGCSYTDTFEVSYFPTVDAGFVFADTVCTSDTLSCFYPTNTDSLSIHHWIFDINGFEMHSFEVAPCIQFSTTGLIEITHIVSNDCDTDTANLTLTVLEPIENGCITIIGQNPFCEGDSVLLTTSGSYVSIEWMDQFGTILGYNDTLAVYSGGVYSANAVDINGCVSTCICTSLQTIPLNATYFPDSTLCTSNSGITYTLPNGFGNWSTGTFGPSETFTIPGDYSVEVTTTNGCTYTDNFTLVGSSLSAPIAYENNGGCIFHFFSNPLQANCTYTWTLSNGMVIGTTNDFLHNHAGLSNAASWVTLTITDTITGCSSQASIFVKWKGCHNVQAGVYPNPFTHELTIEYNFPYAKKIDLVIYDMTGKPVYKEALVETDSETTVSLARLADGVYVVKLFVDENIEYQEKVVKQQE